MELQNQYQQEFPQNSAFVQAKPWGYDIEGRPIWNLAEHPQMHPKWVKWAKGRRGARKSRVAAYEADDEAGDKAEGAEANARDRSPLQVVGGQLLLTKRSIFKRKQPELVKHANDAVALNTLVQAAAALQVQEPRVEEQQKQGGAATKQLSPKSHKRLQRADVLYGQTYSYHAQLAAHQIHWAAAMKQANATFPKGSPNNSDSQ